MSGETGKKAAGKTKSDEELYNEFQVLRSEQRNLANNLGTYEMELKEHRTVIDTLKTIDDNRKCFRLIGGVLCESNVKTVLPQLSDSKVQLEKLIEAVNDQLGKKGQEINKFKEENNIRFEGVPSKEAESDGKPDESTAKDNRNVLVVKN